MEILQVIKWLYHVVECVQRVVVSREFGGTGLELPGPAYANEI